MRAAAIAASLALLKNTLMEKQKVMVATVKVMRRIKITDGSECGRMPPNYKHSIDIQCTHNVIKYKLLPTTNFKNIASI